MTETLLELGRSAAASAQELPLIDLDGTVFVQFGIFLVTALVCSQFLFKPFLAMMTARGEGIEGAREESIRADEEARAKIADYDAKLSKARATAGNERHGHPRDLRLQARLAQEPTLALAERPLEEQRAPLPARRGLHRAPDLRELLLTPHERRAPQIPAPRLRLRLGRGIEPPDRDEPIDHLRRVSLPPSHASGAM